jgi:DNA adenine methylase
MTDGYEPVDGPLKWFGGKAYLAKRLVALMPPHLHYVEPYAGGLSVLLEKDPEGVSEVANDVHGDLVNFWKVLADDRLFPKFVREAQATPFSEKAFQYANHRRLGDMPRVVSASETVGRAMNFFVACRQSRAGQFKDFATLGRTRTRRKMNEQASAWLTCVEGLPAVHARLKRVVILNRDALDVIRQQDGEQTLFYLDPPYLHETRTSTNVYAHEMSAAQHAALLNVLGEIKGKFLLSGYPSDLYEAAENRNGWRHVDYDLPNNAAGGASKARETERVWMNFEEAR